MKIRLYDFFASVSLLPDRVFCDCGDRLYEISNGLLDRLWICESCHNVYQLELRKIPLNKLSKDYIKQSIDELKEQKR